MNNHSEIISLQQLFKKYEPAWGEDWETILNGYVGRPAVEELKKEYKTFGDFQYPVEVVEQEEFVDDAGVKEIYEAAVVNGMHRIAALHQMGETEVRICEEKYCETPLRFFEFSATNTGKYLDNIDLWDDPEQNPYDLLSWRYLGDHNAPWITLSIFGGNSETGEGRILLTATGNENYPIDLKQFAKEVEQRLHNVKILDAKDVTDEE